jgi:hypothetical protein
MARPLSRSLSQSERSANRNSSQKKKEEEE